METPKRFKHKKGMTPQQRAVVDAATLKDDSRDKDTNLLAEVVRNNNEGRRKDRHDRITERRDRLAREKVNEEARIRNEVRNEEARVQELHLFAGVLNNNKLERSKDFGAVFEACTPIKARVARAQPQLSSPSVAPASPSMMSYLGSALGFTPTPKKRAAVETPSTTPKKRAAVETPTRGLFSPIYEEMEDVESEDDEDTLKMRRKESYGRLDSEEEEDVALDSEEEEDVANVALDSEEEEDALDSEEEEDVANVALDSEEEEDSGLEATDDFPWTTMAPAQLITFMTVPFIMGFDGDLDLALVACIDANIVSYRGLSVRALQAFAQRLGLPCNGAKTDIANRLKSYASE